MIHTTIVGVTSGNVKSDFEMIPITAAACYLSFILPGLSALQKAQTLPSYQQQLMYQWKWSLFPFLSPHCYSYSLTQYSCTCHVVTCQWNSVAFPQEFSEVFTVSCLFCLYYFKASYQLSIVHFLWVVCYFFQVCCNFTHLYHLFTEYTVLCFVTSYFKRTSS